jgi:hypothetical protein
MAAETLEWIRLPKPKERCPFTSLSRTTLSELCRTVDESGNPIIKTARLRKAGATKRDILLINRRSLLDYLESKSSGPGPAAIRLAPDSAFPRFTERQIAESRDLFLWAVNPPAFSQPHEWLTGKLASVETRLHMMNAVGLTVSGVSGAGGSTPARSAPTPRIRKRYNRIMRDWTKLTEIERLNNWSRVCDEISRREKQGWNLGNLNPGLFASYLNFVCFTNYHRGTDLKLPKVLDQRTAIKFIAAIRNDLNNIAHNPAQRELLGRKLERLERMVALKKRINIGL